MNKTFSLNRITNVMKSALIVILALLLLCNFPLSARAANEVEYDEPMAGYIDEPYDGDEMWLRETPGGTAVEQLYPSTMVTVTGHGYDKYNYKWYHISFDDKSGYVNYKYVALLTDEDTAFEAQIADFPEYYKVKLRQIHKVYPNYVFQADFVDTAFTTAATAQYRMER